MTTWRNRLKAALDATDLSVAELMRRAKCPPTAWHDIMARGQTPSVDRLASITKALGKTLDEIYLGTETDNLGLELNGVLQGGDMWSELAQDVVRVVPLRLAGSDFVSITVDTSEYEPDYRRGDVVAGQRLSGNHLDNHIGKDVICVTRDGARYIKTLWRGSKPNRYTLRSMHRNVEDIVDVRLQWAAPITMILRGLQ
jgi:transcriptional regulator with XRE-family HTH domain